MNTNGTLKAAMLVGLLAAIPSLAHAMPGDAYDDSTYPTYATARVAVTGPVAGPKAPGLDDATYPDVTTGEEQQAGIAIALTEGPEPYGHDDVSYAAPSSEPNASFAAIIASAR